MAKLIYSMLTSLDGYTEDEHGQFGWGAPEDASVHSFINELGSSFGTYLYGRRMYETNDRLPRGRRARNTVFPGWRAAGVGAGRGAAVPQRCARSAIRRPRDLKARFRVR